MSNEYVIHRSASGEFGLQERSNTLEFFIDDGRSCPVATTDPMTPAQLRAAIVKQIIVLSYFSDDADEVLKRFNVEYGQTS